MIGGVRIDGGQIHPDVLVVCKVHECILIGITQHIDKRVISGHDLLKPLFKERGFYQSVTMTDGDGTKRLIILAAIHEGLIAVHQSLILLFPVCTHQGVDSSLQLIVRHLDIVIDRKVHAETLLQTLSNGIQLLLGGIAAF